MPSELNILVIESDPSILEDLEKKLHHLGFGSSRIDVPDDEIDRIEDLNPNMAILGPSLDTETSLKYIHKLKIIDPYLPVLTSCEDECLSGETASAPFEGVHYLPPDLDQESISGVIEAALGYRAECELRPDYPVIIGQSQAISDIRHRIKKISDKDITLLVTGESGTGKELVARAIHYHSGRCKGPLVKINCGALPDELLESEVFGFQRGAFTGAHRDKPGRLELADGGTLFIDEIGDLSLLTQVKFLQVLEDKAFSRLGGTRDRIIDARVIAATNTDLSEKVREGTFRKDLFYRLNIVNMKVPTLRERRDDIPLLIHYFMNKYCFEFKKKHLDVPEKITNFFMAYRWPGNVRELENVIRRGIVLRDWNFIYNELKFETEGEGREDLLLLGTESPPFNGQDRVEIFFNDRDMSLKKISRAYLADVEREQIFRVLEFTHWNRRKAAELLQVSYKTLLTRIRDFDLKPEMET